MDFSKDILAYGIKVDICKQHCKNDFCFINITGQDHLLTFVLDASDSVFLSSVKLLG